MDANQESVSIEQKKEGCESSGNEFNQDDENSPDYRVTGIAENLPIHFIERILYSVNFLLICDDYRRKLSFNGIILILCFFQFISLIRV